MDEERRKRENYKLRLMEDHEVPDWVYPPKQQPKDFSADNLSITGKRRRKNVSYADPLSDRQWMMAMENGEDLSEYATKIKRENIPAEANDRTSYNVYGEQELSEMNGSESVVSEGGSEDFLGRSPKRLKSTPAQSNNNEFDSVSRNASNGNIVILKTHKKKRSFTGVPRTSFKLNLQPSNSKGRGEGDQMLQFLGGYHFAPRCSSFTISEN